MDIKDLISEALREDIGTGDITTEGIVDHTRIGTARVLSRSEGILSGGAPFKEVFNQLDSSLEVLQKIEDGQPLSIGDTAFILKGYTASILTGERTALNFLGRLSGIATLTRRFVDEIAGTGAIILDTRKTTPLFRQLEKTAVKHGGGANHRFGLYDMVLIKDNHETAAGGILPAVERAMINRKEGILIEVEVQDLGQIVEIIKYPIDRIMLDNFSLEMIEKAAAIVDKRLPIEVSGGVALQNVRQIAETGVNFISIGALTHSAPSLDFTLLLD